ncbi:MAG: NAD(P)/FAD-dependent oxidoreductase [Fimbriiglobus sp.]
MADDVLILGGGVVGTACAYYLAKAGKRVTILERKTLGGACSHGNCGYVCPSHVLPLAGPGAMLKTLRTLLQRNGPLKVRPTTLLKNLGWFLGFARRCNSRDQLSAAVGIHAMLTESRRLYDELLSQEKMQVEWETEGMLFVFQTKAAFEHYTEINELLTEKFSRPARSFDADTLLALEPALKPGAASGGYLYECDAQLRPDRLMTEWRRVLVAQGVKIVENCELQDFVEEGNKARAVRTNQGEFTASEMVFALGAWSPLFGKSLGCQMPIIPGKGYSITMPRPKICPKYPLIFEEHSVAVSPFQSGFRIGSTMEFAGYDDTLNPARLELLRAGARLYLQDPGSGPEEPWTGWRPMLHDGKPIIDRSPKLKNVVIAAGHGMLGISMATGTGRLVADMLTGSKPSLDATAFAANRF